MLLRGREDMLGLVAAQLKYQENEGAWSKSRPIWVDVRPRYPAHIVIPKSRVRSAEKMDR